MFEIIRTLEEYEELYGWKRPSIETTIGRLLILGPTRIDQYSLTKESLELVDKEFAEVSKACLVLQKSSSQNY